ASRCLGQCDDRDRDPLIPSGLAVARITLRTSGAAVAGATGGSDAKRAARGTKRPVRPAFRNNSSRCANTASRSRALGCRRFRLAGAILLLGDAGRLAAPAAQVIELGAADLAAAHDLDGVDHRRIDREHALDPLPI